MKFIEFLVQLFQIIKSPQMKWREIKNKRMIYTKINKNLKLLKKPCSHISKIRNNLFDFEETDEVKYTEKQLRKELETLTLKKIIRRASLEQIEDYRFNKDHIIEEIINKYKNEGRIKNV
jgi:long-subunit acyl-CoA synthetase (AMP-forming)